MTWSYEWAGLPSEPRPLNWLRAKNTWPTCDAATHAACAWLMICAENDFLIAIRLVKVD